MAWVRLSFRQLWCVRTRVRMRARHACECIDTKVHACAHAQMPQVVLMLVYTLMNVYTWQRTFIKQRWCPPTRVECILGTRVSTASLCVFRCMLHLAILIACFADHIIQVRLCGPTGNRRRAPEGTPCHVCNATELAPYHICAGTGVTPSISAPGLSPALILSRACLVGHAKRRRSVEARRCRARSSCGRC